MRYFLDTEFYEQPGSIELISIGLVADDGREYYAENSLFDWEPHRPDSPIFNGDSWLWDNVHPHCGPPEDRLTPPAIARQVLGFVRGVPGPHQFWADYSDYDWVAFCWLFGRMANLPAGFPMFCRDLQQLMWHLSVTPEDLPEWEGTEHNALDDARATRQAFQYIYDYRLVGDSSARDALCL